ncbi:hypothetical protein NKR19_g9010 [Coniochaeta hoffmannii]|uniref:Uncharacterized protein n=1 Tax=Coniochaeta hoffmannii TaxID=91930 RepID=A0AA38R2K1_9PEZI|nr:hypothetical protein NKR19_g9010 [Coniochaeta hoffmannii]
MEVAEIKTLTLPDGRRLGYGIYGEAAPAAPTAFYSTASRARTRRPSSPPPPPATRQGLRIVAPWHPAAGGSDFQPGRTLLDYPADLLALADQLKLDKFASIAVSGGNLYVLVAAHASPIPPRRPR